MDESGFMKEFVSFMAQNGLSNTSQRRAIAGAFFSYPGHHTNDEFYQHIASIDPKIGQTTVYRTLKLLCAAGLASEIQFLDNITRYEVADPHSHHDHLVCLQCGKIVEIFEPRIEALQAHIAEKYNFVLNGHSHNLYGICEECRQHASREEENPQMKNSETLQM